jgi:protoporphyrinogen oxidase
MVRTFGSGISNRYLLPYNRKIWNCEPSQMDCSWVAGRVPQPPLGDIVRAGLGLRTEGYTEQLNFFYPKEGGFQALTDALAARIPDERKQTGFEVQHIKKTKDGWTVSDGRRTHTFPRLVSTIHLLDMLNALDDVPTDMMSAAKRLKWNAVHLTMVGLKTVKTVPYHWLYVPEEKLQPNRISFPSNMSPSNAPSGHFSLLAETTFGMGEKIDKTQLEQEVVGDMESMGLMNSSEMVFSKSIICPYAYPVYTLDYMHNIQILHDYVRSLGGLELVGRFSEFRYYNTDRCVRSAMDAANGPKAVGAPSANGPTIAAKRLSE